MPKTPQKKKIFHMESRLSIIFILNYQRKCGSKVENALLSHDMSSLSPHRYFDQGLHFQLGSQKSKEDRGILSARRLTILWQFIPFIEDGFVPPFKVTLFKHLIIKFCDNL